MSNTNADTPAFPFIGTDSSGYTTALATGLSKREHFAGLAMQGLLANKRSMDITDDALTEVAIAFADRLITALNKEEGKG